MEPRRGAAGGGHHRGASPGTLPEQAGHQIHARSLLGVEVSHGEVTIGEVSDLLVTDDGRVEAIVVSVADFLGLGAKRVALAWISIKLTEQDGSRVFLVSATQEQLEGMPEFKSLERQEAEEAAQQQIVSRLKREEGRVSVWHESSSS